jgi:hypothetical protein
MSGFSKLFKLFLKSVDIIEDISCQAAFRFNSQCSPGILACFGKLQVREISNRQVGDLQGRDY